MGFSCRQAAGIGFREPGHAASRAQRIAFSAAILITAVIFNSK
jgi:hypothetical protein